MISSLKYVAVASIFLMSAAPAVWAQGAGNAAANGGEAGASQGNTRNPGYLTQHFTRYSSRRNGDRTANSREGHRNAAHLTQRMERYSMQRNHQGGFVGDRVASRGDQTQRPTEAGRNAGYLTQRMRGYSLGVNRNKNNNNSTNEVGSSNSGQQTQNGAGR